MPQTSSLRASSAAAHECRGCDLCKTATHVVFGAGPRSARVVLVGEQLGDQEDRQGAPLVGPAGALLDAALVDAGIPRDEVYVTSQGRSPWLVGCVCLARSARREARGRHGLKAPESR